MSISIKTLTLGRLETNCYIVIDDDTKESIIIDPAATGKKILAEAEGTTVREILLTHGHFDHLLAAGAVKDGTSAPLRIHQADIPQLEHSQQLAMLYGIKAPAPTTHDGLLAEGDTITVGSIVLEVLYTPGHSPGHVIFIMRSDKIVFVGDCVFQGSIGRTDFPGSDKDELMDSIFNKILPIGDDFTLYPGHGPITTIGEERLNNPFLQQN